MAFAITCFLRFCLCFFYLACFLCFALFLCCRGQRSRALGKKRERKRLGRDAYFVSARTFSFQDPSLLLSSGQPRKNEWLSRQDRCKVRKLSFFHMYLLELVEWTAGNIQQQDIPWRSPAVRAKYVNSKKVALEILRMFVLNFYEPLLDTSMKSNVRH